MTRLRPGSGARLARSLRRYVLDARHVLEVCVLSPERRSVRSGGCQDDTVRQRKTMLQAHPGGYERHGRGELDDTCLLHEGHGLEGLPLVALLKDPLEYLVQTHSGNQQLANGLDRGGEEGGVRPVGEILEPARGIDDVQTRSSSRGTRVSMPFKNPLIFLIGRTGISSMRFS